MEGNELEEDDICKGFFEFCSVNILNLSKREVKEHVIRVKPTSDWKPLKKEYDALMYPEITNGTKLNLSFPWGRESFKLPLDSTIIYEPENA